MDKVHVSNISLLSMNLNVIYRSVSKWRIFNFISYLSCVQTNAAERIVNTTYKYLYTFKKYAVKEGEVHIISGGSVDQLFNHFKITVFK